MRKFLWIFAILLLPAAVAHAQETSQPRWDISLSAGLFNARPGQEAGGYQEEWYFAGRYAAAIGRYWTDHFKTELEFATTNEGRRFTQISVPVPGRPYPYPISIEEFRRLQQVSARAVWQFYDNAWVHPYLNAGVVADIDRVRRFSPEFYYPPGDPRVVVPPGVVRPQINREPETDYRAGITFGGGSKFYVSPSAYVNAGVQLTYAKPAATATFLVGFGVDF
jgi:hypothetical protein